MSSISEELAEKYLQEKLLKQQEEQRNLQIAESNVYNNNTTNNTAEIIEETNSPKVHSLGTARMIQERIEKAEYMEELKETQSWKNLPTQYLPSQGLFYPADAQITIRPASVQEVRTFSTIDESDIIDVDDKLNMIVEKCTRIIFNGNRVTFKELLEIDRFYIIYSIREITFKDGENKLQMNMTCDECEQVDLVDIRKDNFSFFNIPTELMRFYDENERRFVIKLRESGEIIPIYLPTLGITSYLKQYIRKKQQNSRNYDKAFLKISPFLFDNWKALNDVSYERMAQDSYSWSHKKMSVIIELINMLQKALNPKVTHNCSSCATEVEAPLTFQGGIRRLFMYTFDDTTSILDELI